MRNTALKEAVARLLPRVQMPAQYIGGELNAVVKDHRSVRGKLCLAFPDTYPLGTSHHGLQVLYTLMNNDPQWACEGAFTPWVDPSPFSFRRAGGPYPLQGRWTVAETGISRGSKSFPPKVTTTRPLTSPPATFSEGVRTADNSPTVAESAA
jgi:hypothetical protein